jgi:hypothetical protein
MTDTISSQPAHLSRPESNFLQKAVRGNAVFSGISGLLAVVMAPAAANLMGLSSSIEITIIGFGLLGYVPLLLWIASRQPVNTALAQTIIGLDILWVIGSLALILADPFGLTASGKWVVGILADIVALFALAQGIGLRRQQH